MSKTKTNAKSATKGKASTVGKSKAAKVTAVPAETTKPTSGLDAAAAVLKDAGEPMQAKTIVATMLERKLWTTEGKTPAATIYAAMLREISVKKDASRFRKTGKGLFALNGGK